MVLKLHRYEEAREVEKLRNQKEDFSDMVAEVGFHSHSYFVHYLCTYQAG